MKKDGTRNAADNDGMGTPDAAEVRRRAVNAIIQLVRNVMDQDWALLSSGAAVVAGAGGPIQRTDSPEDDPAAVSSSPSAGVPLGSMDELPSSRPRLSYFPPERCMSARLTPNYELPRRPAVDDRVLNGALRRRPSPSLFDYAKFHRAGATRRCPGSGTTTGHTGTWSHLRAAGSRRRASAPGSST